MRANLSKEICRAGLRNLEGKVAAGTVFEAACRFGTRATSPPPTKQSPLRRSPNWSRNVWQLRKLWLGPPWLQKGDFIHAHFVPYLPTTFPIRNSFAAVLLGWTSHETCEDFAPREAIGKGARFQGIIRAHILTQNADRIVQRNGQGTTRGASMRYSSKQSSRVRASCS